MFLLRDSFLELLLNLFLLTVVDIDKITRKLKGAYTCMLRAALNVHWSQRVTSKKLYNDLPKITEIIRYRWLKFSGHIGRYDEEIAHNLLFWVP